MIELDGTENKGNLGANALRLVNLSHAMRAHDTAWHEDFAAARAAIDCDQAEGKGVRHASALNSRLASP